MPLALTPGYAFATTEQVTAAKLALLVSAAVASGIDQTNLASGSGVVITSSSQPSNTNALWIDSLSSNTLKYYTGSVWTAVGTTFTPSASNALSGSVIQTVTVEYSTAGSSATTIPEDTSIPQITEGAEITTRAITPNNASNTLIIDCLAQVSSSSATNRAILAIFQDATANALSATEHQVAATQEVHSLAVRKIMAAGTTSSTTFRLRAGMSSGTVLWNQASGVWFGGVLITSIIIKEIKA